DPAILIVDEALSVGDARFQAKCFERLRQLKNNGTSILLVTHSSEQVVTHCNRAILLDQSRLAMIGPSRAVINRYLDILFGRDKPAQEDARGPDGPALTAAGSNHTRDEDGPTLDFLTDAYSRRSGYNAHEYRWGDGAASLTDFHLCADGHEFPTQIAPGEEVVLHLALRFNRTVINPILGLTLKTKEGVTVYGTNSYLLECSTAHALGDAGSQARACLKFVNRLATGDYFI